MSANKSTTEGELAIRRRALSSDELLWAENLSREWHRRTDRTLTQERAAELLGYASQSTVSQYINKMIPLNDTAVIAFARLLKIEPGKIKLDLSDITIMHSDTITALTEMFGKGLSEDNKKVFARFERLVDQKRISKVDIARFFDVKPPSIQKWYADRKIPPERLFKIPKLLGCSILELITDNFVSDDDIEDVEPSVEIEVAQVPVNPKINYSKRALTNAVDSIISRPLRMRLGLMRSVEEAAISMFTGGGKYDYASDIIKAALLDVRESGEFTFSE